MKSIITIIKHTTKNARRITYYTITFGDATTAQLTLDVNGTYYIDGVAVTDPEQLKEITSILHPRTP